MDSKNTLSIFITILCFSQLHFSTGQEAVKGGYWAPGTIQASDIDATLFTHLFCAFASLSNNEVIVPSANEAEFSAFTNTVRQKNPSVITLLSIGGGDPSNTPLFDSMASQASSRKSFIDSSIKLARNLGFDGLDLDWEQQTKASEMANLESLLNEWRAAVDSEASTAGKDALILTAAIYFSSQAGSGTNFPVQSIAKSLDWINVMAYDFHSPGNSPVTNAHASLFDPSSKISGSAGISAWIAAGLPAEKIVLGVPFYGYAYNLADANNHGLLAPANGASSVGSPGEGTIAYKQIKDFISQNNAATVYNSTYVTNYCYSGTTWIGYDDTQSVSAKAAYAKKNGLFGYFAWQIGQDSNWALSKAASAGWGA